jgi:hypothetical protein
LKNIYFAVLERFSIDDLVIQKKNLSFLLQSFDEKKNTKKSKNNTIINEKNNHENFNTKTDNQQIYSKNKKNTIMKQITKINSYISLLQQNNSIINNNEAVHEKTVEHDLIDLNLNKSDNSAKNNEVNNNTKNDHHNKNTIPLNPKSRSGWGFWKSD